MIFRRFIKIIGANIKVGKTIKEPANNRFGSNSSPSTSQPFETIKSDPVIKTEAQFYANLELKTGAGFDEIKNAYKKLIKLYHPDVHHNDIEKKKAAELITSRLNEAYKYFKKKFTEKKF